MRSNNKLDEKKPNIANGHVDAFAKTILRNGEEKRIVSYSSIIENLHGTGLGELRKKVIAAGAISAAHVATKTWPWHDVEARFVTQNHPRDAGVVNADGSYDLRRYEILTKFYVRAGDDGVKRLYEFYLRLYLNRSHSNDRRKDPLGLYRFISLHGEWGTLLAFFPNRYDKNPLTQKNERYITLDELNLCYRNMAQFLQLSRNYMNGDRGGVSSIQQQDQKQNPVQQSYLSLPIQSTNQLCKRSAQLPLPGTDMSTPQRRTYYSLQTPALFHQHKGYVSPTLTFMNNRYPLQGAQFAKGLFRRTPSTTRVGLGSQFITHTLRKLAK